MFKNISLRVRLTFLSTIVLIVISFFLTATSIYNVEQKLVTPLTEVIIGEIYVTKAEPLEQTKIENIEYSRPAIQFYKPQAYQPIEISPSMSTIYAAVSTNASTFKNVSIENLVFIILLGSALTYFVSGQALKPVTKFSNEVRAIDEKGLSTRLDVSKASDEIAQLANSFNIMLSKVEQAFENQKRFSSDAAHELKTPLAVLKTNLEVLEMDENPSIAEYEQLIKIFKRQTHRMITLVDDLFAMSENKFSEFNDDIEVQEVFDDIKVDLKQELLKSKVTLELNISPCKFKGNHVMLTRAFSNLVENAIKYNKEHGSILVDAIETEGKCVIKISDTGIGIDDECEKDIFNPFYRIEQSRSRKTAGAGLGLAITKDIIEAHGGAIKYYKNIPQGSVFEVDIPM